MNMGSTPRRTRRGQAILAATLVALACTASLASAQETPDELREQRRKAQQDAADIEVLINALTADADLLVAELDKLREAIDAQQAALDAAQRRVEEALAAEAAAQQAIVGLEAEIDGTEALLLRSAIDAFMGFQGPNSDQAALDQDPWKHARAEALIGFGTGSTTEIIDDLRALGAELKRRREDAAAHTAELDEQRAVVARRKTELDAALLVEEEALAAIEDRLDARLAEVAALEALDAQLAAEIKAEEQRIADAIATRNRRTGPVNIPDDAPVELTTVRGIVVNVVIADQVEGFLAAMAARGYTLSGGGYRSSNSQIALRRAHCGTSDHAIWQMPAYQCRPPTARPGRSAHERGLAIDLTYNGSIIRSRNSDVFQVMADMAPDFGLVNLPGEPWHWSTTGD